MYCICIIQYQSARGMTATEKDILIMRVLQVNMVQMKGCFYNL